MLLRGRSWFTDWLYPLSCTIQAPENNVLYSLADARNPLDYFTIDPVSGRIYISKRVSEDPAKPSTYTVSCYLLHASFEWEPGQLSISFFIV